MLPIQCDKYNSFFKEILALRDDFGRELKKDQTDHGAYLREVQKAKEVLEQKIHSLEHILDIYEIKLRLDITQRNGFNFVSGFTDNGAAWAKFKPARGANGVYYLINKQGECLNKVSSFNEVKKISEGLALVDFGDKKYFVNEKNEVKLGPFNNAGSFSHGLAPVKESAETRYKYIDKEGNPAFEDITFLEALPFSKEGLAVVQNALREWLFINTKGKMVFGDSYGWAESFSEGYAAVQLRTFF